MKLNMSKNKSEKPLVYGSIRAYTPEDKMLLFYESGTTKELTIRCGNGDSFMLNPACLTDKLKTWIHTLDPLAEFIHGDRTEPKILQTIAGIELSSIEQESKDYIRLKFSGRSLSQFEGKMDKIITWLDNNKVLHGEANGSKVCIFKCITNTETELSGFFH